MAAQRDRPIRFAYDAQKAGELAARFLELGGGSMPMLKLLASLNSSVQVIGTLLPGRHLYLNCRLAAANEVGV